MTNSISLSLDKKFTNVSKTIDLNGDSTPDQFIAFPGDNVQFTITVTNNGIENATNVLVKDDLTKQLPVGLIVESLGIDGGINRDLSGEGDGNKQTIEVLLNSIAPGTSKTITVNAKVSDEFIRSLSFIGNLGSADPNTNQLNRNIIEYADTQIRGTLFFNLGVTKTANQSLVNFNHLNINNSAEVISINGTSPLSPITDSARLDISPIKIEGRLANGQPLTVWSVENLASDNPNPVAYFFQPDPLWGSGGGANNHSEFLPPGVNGIANFLSDWEMDKNNPIYQADLAFWQTLSADGNLTDSTDEEAVVDTLIKRFIETGVYSFDRSLGGSFSLNNGFQTQNLKSESGETAPPLAASVYVSVTDAGAIVTNGSGNLLGKFTDLQAALESFNFTKPTGVYITLKDSNGDGKVQTRLQKLGGFNFDRKWSIQTITIDSHVREVAFASGNQSANLDFSLPQFAFSGSVPILKLSSDNAGDKITGTRFADRIEGGNGKDTLSGFEGNDVVLGGNGDDSLNGGRGNDTLTGGNGPDEFVFGANFGSDVITDFSRPDKINLSKLSLNASALDSNGDGVINRQDNLASTSNGNLVLNLTSLSGGTITFTGVTSVDMAAVIL